MHARIAGERASWELYDLNNDRSERRNLAAEHPKKVAELVKAYETWTRRCLVEPSPGQKINQTKKPTCKSPGNSFSSPLRRS